MKQAKRKMDRMKRIAAAALCVMALPMHLGLGEAVALRLEAEDGVMQGSVRAVERDGRGWAEGFKQPGDRVDMPVHIEEEGFYDITMILASADGGHKENPVLLDGENVGACIVDGREYVESTLAYVYLTRGDHTLGLGTSWGWVRLDAVELHLSKPLPDDLYQVEAKLSTPDPTPEAQRLFSWLCDCYGKKIITGQFCDGGMYGLENQAIWRTTGMYPALLGLDLMEYTPSRVERGGNGQSVERAIEYWNNGGIVTFCWHWNAPSPYLTADRWYSGFYTQYTTLNLGKIMSGQDEKGYELLLKDIDAIARQLKRLKDAGVPVLWRPLHEASGGWFWWGASGPDAYKQLWNLLYDRLTNVHGLNNLIWIWNGGNAAWYPGDDTVDIIGEDIYPGERVYNSQSAKFMECLTYTDARKMIILSENGCVPDPELLFRDGTVWGSYCTWGGEFVLKSSKFNKPSEQYTESSMLKKVFSDERTVTRADIPNLKDDAPADGQ